jgi:hypothetical protein
MWTQCPAVVFLYTAEKGFAVIRVVATTTKNIQVVHRTARGIEADEERSAANEILERLAKMPPERKKGRKHGE